MATGLHVSGNVIHDQLHWSYALKSDNGAINDTYADNVTYNNDYDWYGKHFDYRQDPGTKDPQTYDPQLVTGNYWQQGDPPFSQGGLDISGNTIITGPDQAPASILANAGVEPSLAAILTWHTPGETVPSEPEAAAVLYAFQGDAYVTWTPSLDEGNDPVVSYTVNACQLNTMGCAQPGVAPVTISAADYQRAGYAVLTGLTDGLPYTITVTANSTDGPSTVSVPTTPFTPSETTPPLPGPPVPGPLRVGHDVVTLTWSVPSTTTCTRPGWGQFYWCTNPVLDYVVTDATGKQYEAGGLRRLIMMNHGGRALLVIGGLTAGHTYNFSVAAVGPAGSGPAAKFHKVTPGP